MNTIIFNGIKFVYEDKCVGQIDANEIVETYSKITILESENHKFKKGDKLEQISISSTINFEQEDENLY